MIQIIKENRKPSKFQEFSDAFAKGAQMLTEHMTKQRQEQDENTALERLTGQNFSGVQDKDIRRKMAELSFKGKSDLNENTQKLQGNRQMLRQMEKDRGLEQGSLEPFVNDVSLAERYTKPPKEPNKTQASQPIDPQQLDIIKRIRSEPGFDKLSPSKMYQKLTDEGVSKENAKAEADIYAEELKITAEDKKAQRNEEIKFHQESQAYDDNLSKNTKIAKNQIDTIKTIDKAISSGNIKPKSIANVFKEFGPIGHLFAKAYTNADQATLNSSIPSLLEGWKEVFGTRLTDADLKLLQDKLPDIGKTPEANRAILNVIKKYGDNTLLRSKIAEEIKEKNNGLRPLGYENKIEKRYDQMTQPVKIVTPYGKVIEIPAYKLSDAIEDGSSLYTEEQQESELENE